jgi:hypothetical protein
MALGKAALPKTFARWLAFQLKNRYGLNVRVLKNTTQGYEGYGISISMPNYNYLFNTVSSSDVTVVDINKKSNDSNYGIQPSRRIYINGKEEKGYFEVVKDAEDNYYSVHFKPVDKNNPKAFTDEEKEILFRAIADTIPDGAYVSTYGSLTPGGIAGLERFRKMGFVQISERQVLLKAEDEFT